MESMFDSVRPPNIPAPPSMLRAVRMTWDEYKRDEMRHEYRGRRIVARLVRQVLEGDGDAATKVKMALKVLDAVEM